MEDKAGQVLEMMNQFFTLAKLEAGDTELEAVRIPVNEVCREIFLIFMIFSAKRDSKWISSAGGSGLCSGRQRGAA